MSRFMVFVATMVLSLCCLGPVFAQTSQSDRDKNPFKQIVIPLPVREQLEMASRHEWELRKKGKELFDSGQYKEAVAKYKEALTISHGGDNYVMLAECYVALKDYESAIVTYRTIIYPDRKHETYLLSNEPWVLLKYVVLLCDLRKTDEAVAVYKQAMEYFRYTGYPHRDITLPDHFDATNFSLNDLKAAALTGIGIRKAHQRDDEEAAKYLQQAIQLRPNSPIANFYMGFTLYDMGKWKEAKPYLLRARELSPASTAKIVDHMREGRD